MRLTAVMRSLGLLVSLGLSSSALAQEVPGDEAPRRSPQLAVEVGGSLARMNHPSTFVPTTRNMTREVESRASAVRLTGGLHFNLRRGAGRNDLWWVNGVDWYLGDDVDVLAFRPGLEKRFVLARRLTLGVAAYGSAAEVSVPTGQINQDPGGGPTMGDSFYEGRARKWIFGAGGMASLQFAITRVLYTRLQGGYTQFFKKAEDFNVGTEGFAVSLSGPFAAALVGVSF
ncbi:hypothetical protein [Pyxidicoccus fallax]|nr:hypothetical protein [Pyxidicoccus fallax]